MHRYGALTTRLTLFVLAGAATGACHSKPASAPAPVAAARFTSADPHRCIPEAPAPPAELRTVRTCAEEYVRLNGYTPERSHADTTLLAREPFEVGSWDLLLEKRRYAVDPKSLLADCDASGCIVYFRRFVRSQG